MDIGGIIPAMAVAGALGGALYERSAQARAVRLTRALALVLDLFLLSIALAFLNNVYGVTQVTGGSPPSAAGSFSFYTTTTTVAWPWQIAFWLAYCTVPEAIFGATPGKLLAGLRVVRLDGRPLDLGSVVVRNLMRLVDALPLFYIVGGVVLVVSTHSQRLGDLVAGTTVVSRTRAVEPGATRHAGSTARAVLAIVLVLTVLLTIAFDYFGRPSLVIAGLYNEHRLMDPSVTSYTLGQPEWATGSVTYPLTVSKAGQRCTGTIELVWTWDPGFLGWTESAGQLDCRG